MAYTAATTPPMPTAPSEQPTFRQTAALTGGDPTPKEYFTHADVAYPVIWSTYESGEGQFNATPYISVFISMEPGQAEVLQQQLQSPANVALLTKTGLTVTGTNLTLDREIGLEAGATVAGLRLTGKPQSIHWG